MAYMVARNFRYKDVSKKRDEKLSFAEQEKIGSEQIKTLLRAGFIYGNAIKKTVKKLTKKKDSE